MPEVKNIFKILLLLHNMGTKIDEKLWPTFSYILAGREAIKKEKNDIIGYSTTMHSSDRTI